MVIPQTHIQLHSYLIGVVLVSLWPPASATVMAITTSNMAAIMIPASLSRHSLSCGWPHVEQLSARSLHSAKLWFSRKWNKGRSSIAPPILPAFQVKATAKFVHQKQALFFNQRSSEPSSW